MEERKEGARKGRGRERTLPREDMKEGEDRRSREGRGRGGERSEERDVGREMWGRDKRWQGWKCRGKT